MGRVSVALNTFNSGEWSPRLYGRSDTDRYRGACSELFNMVLAPQGGAMRRMGFRYLATTRLNQDGIVIPFRFSTDQAYVIVATGNRFRFFRNRAEIEVAPGNPYQITTPYTLADLAALKWTQSADTLFLVHPDFAPRKLVRFGNANWHLSTLEFRDGPYGPLYSGTGQGNGANVVGIGLGVSAINGDAVTVIAVPNGLSISGAVNNGAGEIRITTSTAHKLKTDDPVRIASVTGTTEANGDWTVTKISSTELDLQGSTFANAYVAGGNLDARVFAPTDVGRLLRKLDANLYWGHARITAVTNCFTATVNVLEPFSVTTQERTWRLGAFSETSGWPSSVTLYEERLFFSATPTQPTTLWGSVTGDFTNFAPTDTASSTTEIIDSDAVTLTIADDEIDIIRWIKGMRVLAGASAAGEFVLQASSLNEAITPSNAKYTPSTRKGSADMAPIKVGNGAMFIGRNRNRLYEFAYSVDSDFYASEDLSIFAEHLTGRLIRSMAYQDQPYSTVWCACDDGTLIALSYMKEQSVIGWHQHTLGGEDVKVRSVACIPSDTQTELYAIVERTVNGQTVRYVEVMEDDFQPSSVDDKAHCFYVDSGFTYNGAPGTTISGLDHLEGESVTVLADGAVHPNRTVSSGDIELAYPASVVQIGLGYQSRLATMPLDYGAQDGSALGRKKRVSRVALRFQDTLGAKIGKTADGTLEEILFRPGQSPMDASAPLFTGVKIVHFPEGWDYEAIVMAIQSQPLPMYILAAAPLLTTMEG